MQHIFKRSLHILYCSLPAWCISCCVWVKRVVVFFTFLMLAHFPYCKRCFKKLWSAKKECAPSPVHASTYTATFVVFTVNYERLCLTRATWGLAGCKTFYFLICCVHFKVCTLQEEDTMLQFLFFIFLQWRFTASSPAFDISDCSGGGERGDCWYPPLLVWINHEPRRQTPHGISSFNLYYAG